MYEVSWSSKSLLLHLLAPAVADTRPETVVRYLLFDKRKKIKLRLIFWSARNRGIFAWVANAASYTGRARSYFSVVPTYMVDNEKFF